MRTCLTLLISLGFLTTMGCATQRPQMPDEKYVTFANAWNIVGYCAYKGWMDADTAARGKTYISSAINTYAYSQEDMVDTIKGGASRLKDVSMETCRMVAVDIQTRKQQIANQNIQADIQQREIQNMINSTKSTNVYCNKIGTQVLCNSF
jgi:hypothetical protein